MNILIVLAAILPAALSTICPENHFWSDDSGHCLKCDKCEKNQIIIKDCHLFANTECATVPDPHAVDKAWLKKKYDVFDLSEDDDDDDDSDHDSSSLDEPSENELDVDDDQKKHVQHHLLKLHDEGVDDDNDDIFQDFLATHENKMKTSRKKKKAQHKNKKHYSFKQRINDKMMKWRDDDDLKEKKFRKSYDVKHPKHFHFVADDDDTDFDVFGLGWGKPSEQKHPKNKSGKHKKVKDDDEVQLEELLVESRKQLKQRKDDLLKNMKEDEQEEESIADEFEDKKTKLNYPLYNDLIDEEAALIPKQKPKKKPTTGLRDNIFKDLIKSDESKELELEALMSNKKDSLNYREVEPKHRMFLGEPSTISEIIGQVKDPEEVIKEEMGSSHLYSRAKFNVIPLTSSKDQQQQDEVSAVPFSAAERFVWDWQNVAMASAVAACSVFFLVVTVYCLVCSSHWNRRPKSTSYTDDMEEMTTRVALMQPTIELGMNDGMTTGKYLEQVLGPKH